MWPKRKKPETPPKTFALDPATQTLFRDLVNAMAPRYLPAFTSSPVASYAPYTHQSTPEEIETEKKETGEVDAFITKMEPDIKTQTEALIKEEIRDMLLLGGNRQRILALLRAGKTPRLVRKKEGRRDPLFLQFGDGVADPIEEMQILG